MGRNFLVRLIFVSTLALYAVTVFASSNTVTNTVSVSASTGGSSANGGVNGGTAGSVSNGQANTSVKVNTVINGEQVENFDQTFSGDTKFEKTFEKTVLGGAASTTIKVESGVGAGTIASTTGTDVKIKVKEFSDHSTSKIKKMPPSRTRFAVGSSTEATSSVVVSSASSSAGKSTLGSAFNKYLTNFFKHVFSIFNF